jgi:hypothetical protein
MKAKATTDKTILILFISIYSILLVFKANFSLIDDHLWLDTIFSGKFLYFGFDPQYGRFNPFVFQEYNFISIFCKKPTCFYAFNALQIVIIAIILYRLLKRIINHQLIVILFIVFLFFQPAFVQSYFRLQMPEKDSFFLFLIFIYCYFKLVQQDELKYLIIGLICANLALYFKEPGFISVGSLAFVNILLYWKKSTTRKKIFDLGLLFSSIVYLLLYLIIIFPYIETRYGAWISGDKIHLTIKVLANFILSDPFLFIGLPLVLAYRLYRIFSRKDQMDPFYDPLIISALSYILVFPILRIFAYRSALPAYAFGILPLAFYGRDLLVAIKTTFDFFKLYRVIYLVIFILLLNSSMVGLHQLTFWKNLAINHQAAIKFIAKEINSHGGSKKKRIFLRGANRANEIEVYVSLGKYLHYQMGLNYSQFDLNSEEPPNNPLLTFVDPNSPFSVFQSTQADQLMKGDYVLITPFSSIISDDNKLKSLEKDYSLIFKTNTRFHLGTMGLKSILKYLVIHFDLIEILDKKVVQGVDYYLFKKIN